MSFSAFFWGGGPTYYYNSAKADTWEHFPYGGYCNAFALKLLRTHREILVFLICSSCCWQLEGYFWHLIMVALLKSSTINWLMFNVYGWIKIDGGDVWAWAMMNLNAHAPHKLGLPWGLWQEIAVIVFNQNDNELHWSSCCCHWQCF